MRKLLCLPTILFVAFQTIPGTGPAAARAATESRQSPDGRVVVVLNDTDGLRYAAELSPHP